MLHPLLGLLTKQEMLTLSGLGLVAGVLPLYLACLSDGGIRGIALVCASAPNLRCGCAADLPCCWCCLLLNINSCEMNWGGGIYPKVWSLLKWSQPSCL